VGGIHELFRHLQPLEYLWAAQAQDVLGDFHLARLTHAVFGQGEGGIEGAFELFQLIFPIDQAIYHLVEQIVFDGHVGQAAEAERLAIFA